MNDRTSNGQKNKICVALYLPLGYKNRLWSGVGGAEKRLSYLISHMDPERFDVTVVIRSFNDPDMVMQLLSRFISPNCKLVYFNGNRKAFLHFAKEKYDCVLYDDCMAITKPGIFGAALAGSRRVIIFVTVGYSEWKFPHKWHALVMRQNVDFSNRIDCLYPRRATCLQKMFPGKPVTITPCSLPFLEEFIAESSDSVKENAIVFSGRLIPDKNPLLFLDAVDLALSAIREKGYQAWICGVGPQEGTIRERIAQRGYGDTVRFLGVQDMHEILPRAKVFCSLQQEENYPSQALQEAIASGCYCIATDVGDTNLMVKVDFGVLVPPTPQAVAQSMQAAMCLDEDAFAAIRKHAHAFAEQTFDVKYAISHYESVCEAAVSRRKA